jgi:hypothetical protein
MVASEREVFVVVASDICCGVGIHVGTHKLITRKSSGGKGPEDVPAKLLL